MKQINWKVRLRHRQFWVALIALLLILVNQIAGIFGMDITVYNDQVTSITETVLSILALLGIIIDPTTKGFKDTQQALSYQTPKGDEK